MAKDDSQQGNPNTGSRVYKSSGVHKRRVDRKGRPKDDASQQQIPAPGSAEPSASQGVVLTPEFNKRTEAQKAADDRWFAAMREGTFREETLPSGIPVQRADSSATVPSGPQAGSQAAPQVASQVGPEGNLQGSPTAPIPVVAPTAGQPGDLESESTSAAGPASTSGFVPVRSVVSTSRDSAKPRSSKRVVLIVVGVVALLAIVAAVLFAWNRWWRFDDHADIQGQWYVVGTTVPVTIDDSSIHLTDDVVYSYALNPQDKTIGYAFGPMGGQGRYWFSDDRQYLVITDGDKFTAAGTAVDDLLHAFSDLPDKATGNDLKLPQGEGIIAFSREPDAEAAAEKAAAEKAAAEKAAAEKAAAEKAAAEQAAAEAAEAEAAEEEYYDDGGDEGDEYVDESTDENNEREDSENE